MSSLRFTAVRQLPEPGAPASAATKLLLKLDNRLKQPARIVAAQRRHGAEGGSRDGLVDEVGPGACEVIASVTSAEASPSDVWVVEVEVGGEARTFDVPLGPAVHEMWKVQARESAPVVAAGTPLKAYENTARGRAAAFTDSNIFHNVVTAVILLCAAVFALERSDSFQHAPELIWLTLDWGIALFFVIEMALRLMATPAREFFRTVEFSAPNGGAAPGLLRRMHFNPEALWNTFDFAVAALSCAALVWHVFPHADFFFVARLARGFRLLRLFGITARLRAIEAHIVRVVPTVFSFVLLLTILIYMYAVIGSHLFADVHIPEPNFETLPDAFVTMFQVLTFDGWSQLLRSLTPTHPISGPLFFMSFIGLTVIIMLNIFVAVLTGEVHDGIRKEQERTEREIAAHVAELAVDADNVHTDAESIGQAVRTLQQMEQRLLSQFDQLERRMQVLNTELAKKQQASTERESAEPCS